MIIAVSVVLVSAVVLAMSNAKKEKLESKLNAVEDANMGLNEENRVLNACLETMEPELEKRNQTANKLAEEKMRTDNLFKKTEMMFLKELNYRCDEAEKEARKAEEARKEAERWKKEAEAAKKTSGEAVPKQVFESMLRDRDTYEQMYLKRREEAEAYKKMYQEATKKAPQ